MGRLDPLSQLQIVWTAPIDVKRAWIKAVVTRAFGPGGCNYMPTIPRQGVNGELEHQGILWGV
jgi:hypothetical protein